MLFTCKRRIEVPNTLKIAFEYLDYNWKDEQRLEFNKLENKEFAPVYYGYNIEDDLQHNLLKNHTASLKLNSFFDSLGVYRSKDKSGLIINTYFNYINKKQINLQDQVNAVKAYWQPIEDCTQSIRAKAIDTYIRFNVNDKVKILLPVNEHNNAIDYNCPNNSWVFKEGTDLKITARLIDKSISKDSLKGSFKLQVLSKSNEYTEIMYQEIFKRDTFSISLFNSWKISNP